MGIRNNACYCYKVTGIGQFPWDMLRRDGAFPFSQWDSDNINRASRKRTIELRSYSLPNVARWNSFGWRVESCVGSEKFICNNEMDNHVAQKVTARLQSRHL